MRGGPNYRGGGGGSNIGGVPIIEGGSYNWGELPNEGGALIYGGGSHKGWVPIDVGVPI